MRVMDSFSLSSKLFLIVMKYIATFVLSLVATVATQVCAADAPKLFEGLLEKEKPVNAELVVVSPPEEFNKFVQKLSEVAQKDPKWYEEHSKKTPAGSPIPLYDAKLGMTKEEYAAHLKVWSQREVKKIADVALMLRETENGEWMIQASGEATPLSLIHFDPKTGSFTSPNGKLERIEDIKAPAESLFGNWKGQEWRYWSEGTLGKTKENIALGKTDDGKYGMLIYRLQEVTGSGRPLLDQSMVIRFLLKK